MLALGAGLLVLIAGTIHDTLAAEFTFTGIAVTVWAVIVLAILAGIMYLGVALSTRFQLVLALLSVATVLLFAIHVIVAVGGDNKLASTFNPSKASNCGGALTLLTVRSSSTCERTLLSSGVLQ